MQVPELGQSAARARQTDDVRQSLEELRDQEKSGAPEVVDVETAFLVYRLPDGQVVMDANINAAIAPRRGVVAHDVIGMANCVIEDVRLMATAPAIAHETVNAVEARQREVVDQAKNAQIAARIAQTKNGSRG